MWRRALRLWTEHCNKGADKVDAPETLLSVSQPQAEACAEQEQELERQLSAKAKGKQPLSVRRGSDGAGAPAVVLPPTALTLRLKRSTDKSAFGMTVSPKHNRVSEVKPGSPAEAAGFQLFDKVVAVDKVALTGKLAPAVSGKLTPKLGVERPAPSSREQIARQEAPEGAEEWITAVIACSRGDGHLLGSCLQCLHWRGEEVSERRLDADAAAAVALRTFAETGTALQLSSGILLVEVALESGHHDLVQLLLHESGPLASSPPAAARGKHARSNSQGAGGSKAAVP